MEVPPFTIRIFHEINHPAIKGYPHDLGNKPIRLTNWGATYVRCVFLMGNLVLYSSIRTWTAWLVWAVRSKESKDTA